MLRTWLSLGAVAALSLAACGKQPPPPPDAGVDDSCGIDCAQQEKYGLIAETCFEYSGSLAREDFPALGVWVRPVEELEGGVKAIPLEYLENGSRKMTDLFILQGGELRLARRIWTLSAESVTYRDEATNIVGAAWWQENSGPGVNFKSSVVADVNTGGQRLSEPTEFAVSVGAPTESEKTVPHGTFAEAGKILINENPPHGMDGRRVFAEGVGFTLFSSRFALAAGTAREFRLQDVRVVGTEDGGTHGCGLAGP